MENHVRYVALGDCNTTGELHNIGNAYPERIAKIYGWNLENYGYTMSTTREGIQFFNLKNVAEADVLSIQFGLVDSWLTYKGAPYVLYYPDSSWRKILRKFVKKIKKYARKLKWHKIVGQEFVIPLDEYISNLNFMITQSKAKNVFLMNIVPNQDLKREPQTKKFNEALKNLADGRRVIYIDCYDLLKSNFIEYYDDSTHLSSQGQQVVTEAVLAAIRQAQSQ